VTKAKAVKPIAEQMITLGRRGDLHARRQATAFLRSRDVVHKLFAEVAPRFEGRPGGYLRIVKIGPRFGDAADMVYLELVDSPLVFKSRMPDEIAAAVATAGAPAAAEAAEEEELDEIEETDAEAEADGAEPEAEADVAAEAGEAEEAEAEETDEAEPDEAEAPDAAEETAEDEPEAQK
jgi:large subunit ribosomal protein L17